MRQLIEKWLKLQKPIIPSIAKITESRIHMTSINWFNRFERLCS